MESVEWREGRKEGSKVEWQQPKSGKSKSEGGRNPTLSLWELQPLYSYLRGEPGNDTTRSLRRGSGSTVTTRATGDGIRR